MSGGSAGKTGDASHGVGARVFGEAMATCRTHLMATWIFSALIALLYLAPTLYMMQVYDRVLPTRGVLTLIFLSAILLVALFVHSYLDGVRQDLLLRASLRLERVLAPRLLAAGFEDVASTPRRNQVLREFDTFRQAAQGAGALGMLDLTFAPLFVLVSFMLHWSLGVMVVGGGALLVAIAIVGERVGRGAVGQAAALAPAAYAAAEAAHANRGLLRALGMRSIIIDRLVTERRDISNLNAKTQRLASRFSGFIRLARMILQSASLGLAAYLAVQQQLSPGALIAASVLAGRALAPIEQIVGSWRQLVQAREARMAMIRFLDHAPPARERQALPAPTGALKVEGLAVRAPGGDKPILANISFEIAGGEVLAVIGPSGAGKSTLARVLVGAQTPATGFVRLDGSNLADWDPDQLGRHLGYLPQDPGLLIGTVGANIRRFSTDPADEPDVITAAEAAGVHALIQRLPQGYDTPLGPRGEGLSTGQSQRVALARALFRSPRLIVLDEPNANLDADGDAALTAAIAAARERGATVVIMTHRSGVLGAVDKVLVLREGQVSLFGPREVVVQKLRDAAVQAGQVRAMPKGTP